ncbi:hypothetical protein GRF59_26540 [Paenibacillus sp. HJL G12]|uniref:Uncharacterized protein n=1 Tax=Paenibacillus dendrobii TaxID=2691084 RepID=A0A7X3IP85_9BACL|nr:hypothetical protein [Paenibacillus dendrobii]MWV47158.1 hypothetical protein [Paenibacillus dendrobii]
MLIYSKKFLKQFNVYKEEKIDDFIKFPAVDDRSHTMANAIDEFCFQKLPIIVLKDYLERGYSLDILGVFPEIFKLYFYKFNYKNIVEIGFNYNPRVKFYNYVRPLFFVGNNNENEKKIIVSIPPGEDYLKHYTSILRHLINKLRMDEKTIKIFRFPLHEKNITEWTGLNNNFVKRNDIVILGYTEEIENNLNNKMTLESEHYNEFYGSRRYKLNGKIINFLGVKYSYWGNMSKNITNKLLFLGATEIIYSAKLGTLVNYNDIYNKIYSPIEYIVLDYTRIKHKKFKLKNNFVKLFPEFNSGLHCSVPTILEQNYRFRDIVTNLSINSIDNEISQMAEVVYEHNRKNNSDISFFAVHFPTDYVRKYDEKNLDTKFDLSNNRLPLSSSKKRKIINEISNYLHYYLVSYTDLSINNSKIKSEIIPSRV